MYLKSLKLVGFKSFADRTRLEFRPGVTVVVGPNGSGKSNLVDALSWVMGTQSTRALRTERMEDVIFAGTATRPSLNRAEVTLLIDNAERMIPLDLDEVSLTRRLYRDGSSEYEINGVGCRLLDIQDLLSDSGVGRHQHVIIGQGEIGRVLNASPEDHRAVIEEAAGVLKHRRRKERAERRLERTDDDLIRLRDLVGEIERQMRPLKRQARAAERYDGLKAGVRDLHLYLARHTLERYGAEIVELEAEQLTVASQVEHDGGLKATLSADLTRLTDLASTVGADLERDTAAAARLETTVERLRRMGSVAHERIKADEGRRGAEVERKEDLESEHAAIDEEMGSVVAVQTEAADLAAAREAAFRSLEDEERAIAIQTSLSPEGAVAAVRGELSVLQAALARDAREEESVAGRLKIVGGQVRDEAGEIAGINDEVRSTDERLSELSVVYESAIRARTRDQEAWSQAEQTATTAKLDQAAAQARVEAVAAALEGSFDVEARRQVESATGALGNLVSILDVPEGLERAVDAALGGWVGSVAFTSVEEMQMAVEAVKSSGVGGIPVVSVTSPVSSPASEVAAVSGVEALVDRLGPGKDAGLASRLLGDVLLVEGWTTAWSLVRKHPALRAVTPEGDLISVAGVQIAHPDGVGPAMLEASEVAQEKAETGLARAESIFTAAKRDFEKSREAERAALEALEAIEASLAGKTEAMARLQKSVDVLEEEQSRLTRRSLSLTEGAAEHERQIAQLQQRLSALEGEEAARVRIWEEMESRRLDLAAAREVARSEWQEAATRNQSVSERRKLLEERVTRIKADLARVGEGQPGQLDTGTLESVESYARRSVEILSAKLRLLRDRQAELRQANQGALAELETARGAYETTQAGVGSGRERLGQIEVRLTELRLQKESVVEGVRRDADAEIEATEDAVRPDYPEDADLEQILEEKTSQLRRLGPINPLASAEYAEMSERHEFLTSQLADVESSRAELRKVITALEAEIDQRFQEAFDEVAEAYQRYFSILFPGGRGRIKLTDPEEAHSGLIIDAQPLGKKVSQLTLLSGGEQSLAALAFLFSVFEARPSPFYVLDEVEAALDDANLRRFLKIVDEFRLRAQLLIVTHQQQTMGAADVLYGVTMEPGGSSQAVRKDMTKVGVDQVA